MFGPDGRRSAAADDRSGSCGKDRSRAIFKLLARWNSYGPAHYVPASVFRARIGGPLLRETLKWLARSARPTSASLENSTADNQFLDVLLDGEDGS